MPSNLTLRYVRGKHIATNNGAFLFSLEDFTISPELPAGYATLTFLTGLILCAIAGWWLFVLLVTQYPIVSVKGILLIMIVTRGLLLQVNMPAVIGNTSLFDARYYASSWLSPSLGDMLVSLTLLLIWIGVTGKYMMPVLKNKIVKPAYKGILFSVVTALHHLVTFGCFKVVSTLFYNAQWNLDITANLNFDGLKAVAVLIFVLASICFFLFSHYIARLLLGPLRMSVKKGFLWGSSGTAVITVLLLLTGTTTFNIVIIMVHGLYLWLMCRFSLPDTLWRLQYRTYIYCFSGALACGIAGAAALYGFKQKEMCQSKAKFASQLLTDSDVLGEFMLNEAIGNIRQDQFIAKKLINPFAGKEVIEQKVKRAWLNSYFNKYDVQVMLFDAMGLPLNARWQEASLTYPDLVNLYAKPRFRTQYDNVFYLNDLNRNIFKRYVSFIPITEKSLLLGYMVIDLKLKASAPASVYPALLVDKRYEQPHHNNQYSYAIYSPKDVLLFEYGNKLSRRYFNKDWLHQSNLYEKGISRTGIHHLAIKSQDDRTVVVFSPVYDSYKVFTNFSFLFLILVVVTLTFVGFRIATDRLHYGMPLFSTRIQIYMNLIFFLPLLVLSGAVLALITFQDRQEVYQDFKSTALEVSKGLSEKTESYLRGQISISVLNESLEEAALLTNADLNLYNIQGRLIAASQPAIFAKDLLSDYMNPTPYGTLLLQNEQTTLATEQIGSLTYSSVYTVVEGQSSNSSIGILSVPFFTLNDKLNNDLLGVVSITLNVFVLVFMLFLVLSYLASQALINPLQLVASKLTKTTLEDNDPLHWPANDEIGTLVQAYNQMLVKLEENRKALAESEKTSAWREMAQQVAHEIKNPLMPMKLTLQRLQRLLQKDDMDKIKTVTEKSAITLLNQIDTLSDIATSFSSFAKMPAPKEEIFDLKSVVTKTTALYQNDQNADFIISITEQPVHVLGDSQLTGQILLNLILNAIQSVPSDKKPQIIIELSVNEKEQALLSVQDNGSGIPEEVQQKVFVPNFSTKFTGSGIGLALAKRGIEHAGGSIWFQTEQNKGTAFYILLPTKKL